MRTILALALIAMTGAAPNGAQVRGKPTPINFVDSILFPADQQDPMTQAIARQLALTAVPRASDAVALANASIHASGQALDARDSIDATWLSRLAQDAPGFAAQGDLIWEVRVSRWGGQGLARVMWISTTTKTVKVLFGLSK